jgi:hypothetical protein
MYIFCLFVPIFENQTNDSPVEARGCQLPFIDRASQEIFLLLSNLYLNIQNLYSNFYGNSPVEACGRQLSFVNLASQEIFLLLSNLNIQTYIQTDIRIQKSLTCRSMWVPTAPH